MKKGVFVTKWLRNFSLRELASGLLCLPIMSNKIGVLRVPLFDKTCI